MKTSKALGKIAVLAMFLTACSGSVVPASEPISESQPTAAFPGQPVETPVPATIPSAELSQPSPTAVTSESLEPAVAATDAATPTTEAEPTHELPSVVINRRVPMDEDIRFPFLLPFDGIRPVYNPEFASAGDAPLQDDELVIGITLGGEAKAYPITVLRFREMVNDELSGIPILVTW